MIFQMTLTPIPPGSDCRTKLSQAVFSLPAKDGALFASDGPKVYSHCRYQVCISQQDDPALSLDSLKKARVFINDEPVSVGWTSPDSSSVQGRFYSPNDGLIFRDAYGFVEIAVLLDCGGTPLYLRSGLLAVMVRESNLNRSVQEMAEYVYARQEAFLFSGETKSLVQGGLKKSGQQNAFTMIALAQEAAGVFEESYPYFKANGRFQIQKTPTLQPLERLQYISQATIQYAACHPEELQPAAGRTGIRAGRRSYQPRRALGLANTVSMVTYENQVLLGFLKTLLESVRRLRIGNGALLDAPQKQKEAGLVFSPNLLLAPLRQHLHHAARPLQPLEERLARLLRLYSRILPVAAPALRHAPKPTAVFRSVPEYNRIFTCCRRWFQFGLFDLFQQQQMLPFLKIPVLYEVYILSRLFDALENDGWSQLGRERLDYPLPAVQPPNWPAPPAFGNAFSFQKDGAALTVFYQPVVYSGMDPSAGSNGVGLCRNTSISYQDEPDPCSERGASHGFYYTPDFVLKIQRNNRARYLVADAKFTSLSNVKRYQLPALAYKYLFSLSPLHAGDVLSGLCIFCGQSVKEPNAFRDVRDLLPDAQPFAAILTFPGGSSSAPLMELLKKYLR